MIAAIGAVGVAAAGGDENAVREAFLKAGSIVVVQDGFRQVTGQDFDAKSSKGEAYCISPASTNCQPLPKSAVIGVDEKGNFIVDMKKVDPTVPAVGLKDHTAYFKESNAIMTSVSRVPGMQAMAVFHDQWAISWAMGSLATPATILPAIVLTYIGTGAPYYESLQTTAVESALVESGGSKPNAANQDAKPFAPFVIDSYVKLDGERLVSSVVHQQAPEHARVWCSRKGEFLIKKKIPFTPFTWNGKKVTSGPDLELVTCDKHTNWGIVQSSYPSDLDYACRVLVREKGSWRVVAESLFDRNKCGGSVQQTVKSATGSGVWYRGDARR